MTERGGKIRVDYQNRLSFIQRLRLGAGSARIFACCRLRLAFLRVGRCRRQGALSDVNPAEDSGRASRDSSKLLSATLPLVTRVFLVGLKTSCVLFSYPSPFTTPYHVTGTKPDFFCFARSRALPISATRFLRVLGVVLAAKSGLMSMWAPADCWTLMPRFPEIWVVS
jgi:hypothetical protein